MGQIFTVNFQTDYRKWGRLTHDLILWLFQFHHVNKSSLLKDDILQRFFLLTHIWKAHFPLCDSALTLNFRQAEYYMVSQKKVSDKIFPQRLPNGRGLRTNRKLCCRTPGRLPESACYFFEGMTRSSRMLHSSAKSWSIVHVRWEVVEEKFYHRLFSGTPCTFLYNFISRKLNTTVSAQRVGFFNIGSGQLLEIILGSKWGSGRVVVLKYTIGYFWVLIASISE